MSREEYEATAKEYYDSEVFGYPDDEPPEKLAYELAQSDAMDNEMGEHDVSPF